MTIKVRRIVAPLLFAAWAGLWFWAFSFAYSDGFFLYDRHSRIPIFVAALAAAILIPISAVLQWKRYDKAQRGGVRTLLTHVATSLVILAVPSAVFSALARAPRPWRLEADDAMGAGIDFLLLCSIAILSIGALGVAIAVGWYRRRSRHLDSAG